MLARRPSSPWRVRSHSTTRHPGGRRCSSLRYCPISFARRAWPAGRRAGFGATPDLHHGLLAPRPRLSRSVILAGAPNAATSRSKARSARARGARRRLAPSRRDGRAGRNRNPFLADFYADRPGAALPGAALLSAQPPSPADRRSGRRDLFSQTTICDYVFDKDKIFAYLRPRRQRAVHLSAAVRTARARCAAARSRRLPAGADRRAAAPRQGRRRRRGRARSPDADYLRELNEAYHHFFFHYNATPLLVVETSQFDLAWPDAALDDLLRQIQHMHGGKHYYVPSSRRHGSLPADTAGHRQPGPDLPWAPALLLNLMAWFKRVRKPIVPRPEKPAASPEGLWVKCPDCSQAIYNKELVTNLGVCPKCSHHFRLGGGRSAADACSMANMAGI